MINTLNSKNNSYPQNKPSKTGNKSGGGRSNNNKGGKRK